MLEEIARDDDCLPPSARVSAISGLLNELAPLEDSSQFADLYEISSRAAAGTAHAESPPRRRSGAPRTGRRARPVAGRAASTKSVADEAPRTGRLSRRNWGLRCRCFSERMAANAGGDYSLA